MVVLDMSIVNVALATIKSDLGFSAGEPAVGDHRLRDRLRRLPAARRPPGRPPRPPPRSSSPASRSSPSAPRSAASPGRPARSSSSAGSRASAARCSRRPGLSLLMTTFREGPRAQPRARHLGRGLRQRRSGRRPARRRPDLVPLLAVDLLSSTSRSGWRSSCSRRAGSPRAALRVPAVTSTSPAPRRSRPR